MAKIHVRGGSPLTLEFTDNQNNPNPKELQLKKAGNRYFVVDKDDKKLMAFGPFTTTPGQKGCEIGYGTTAPTTGQATET